MEDRTTPAGILGQYYSARHKYGHYRSCAVTGRYKFPQQLNLSQSLKPALNYTIEQHPSLCYSMINSTRTTVAQFQCLKTIEWDDVVEFHTSERSCEGEEDIALSHHLGIGHQHIWTDPEKPIWKIIVLSHPPRSSEDSLNVDIALIFHHALGDASSGCAFHKTLLDALSITSPSTNSEDSWPLVVPPTLAKPILLEDVTKLISETISTAPESPPTTAHEPHDTWTGAPPSMASIDAFRSRVSLVTIPAAQVKMIVQGCRRLNITMTGLLHSLIVIYLSKTIEEARAFEAVTPYSMRRSTGLSQDEFANHVSYITTRWGREILETARRAAEGSEQEEQLVVRISSQFQEEIKTELERVPRDGPLMLRILPQIKDFDRFCEEGMRGKRGSTYEISNVGAVKLDEVEAADAVRLEKLVFTQCGMVCGPAVGCSVVSIQDGPMVVSLHWQDGIVEQEVVGKLKALLLRRLLSFS